MNSDQIWYKGSSTGHGADPQNPTFDLPCRDVFAKGQKAIEVTGPFPELAPAAAKVHEGYWNK